MDCYHSKDSKDLEKMECQEPPKMELGQKERTAVRNLDREKMEEEANPAAEAPEPKNTVTANIEA